MVLAQRMFRFLVNYPEACRTWKTELDRDPVEVDGDARSHARNEPNAEF